MPSQPQLDSPSVIRVPVDLIVPGRAQARRRFDPSRLEDLAESIRESGIVQPVVLRHLDETRYELLAGERRWRAAQIAGLHELPAIVRDDLDDDEARVLGLVENLQRESLSPMETADGLQALAARFELTHEQVGHRIGKSRAYVTNFLRLLGLDRQVREQLDNGQLTLGHAKILCGLSVTRQKRLAAMAANGGLSVRALERRASRENGNKPQPVPRAGGDLARLERTLGEQLGYAVRVQADAKGVGSLTMRFSSLDELDGLLHKLGYDPDA